MANNNPHLLKILKNADFGIFVNSMKHLSIAVKSGFEVSDIIYTTTGISQRDMEFIIQKNISINLDSLEQVKLYGSLNSGGSIGVRLNIDEKSRDNIFIGSESRIGILETEFPELLEIASRYSLKIIGTHVYLGTNIISFDEMIAGTKKTLDLSEHFPDLEYIDLGGGFPIDGENGQYFDYDKYGELITELFNNYSKKHGRSIKLILEPGRSLFGDTAVFCSQVLDVKERPDRFLISCDASASILPRSMFYNNTFHNIEVLGKQNAPKLSKPAGVVGSTTYSRDYLGKDLQLPMVEIGDILMFKNAGSYCYAMITQFLGQAMPSEVLIDTSGKPKLIRERETFQIAI
jgi:diaminopimelate decarboxylase